MGHNLVAESFHALIPGQIVQTRVQTLGPPLVLALTGDAGSESASIARALQDLGLLDDNLNRAIVKGLVGKGLSVELDTILNLRDLYISLGLSPNITSLEDLDDLVAKILFLQGQGLPVTPDAISSYLSRVPSGVLGGLMEGLVELLRTFHAPETLTSSIQDLTEGLKPSDLTENGLRQFLNALGIDLEGRLASWIASGGRGVPGDLDRTLKLSLLALQNQLATLDASTLDASNRITLSTLTDRLSEALVFLDTLQAANLPTPDRQGLHLQIPFLLDGHLKTADLDIERKGSPPGAPIDPENISFTLSIDLTELGPVRIHLSVVAGRAICNIHVADQQRSEFIESIAEELARSLDRCGYTGARISCRTNNGAEDTGESPSVGLDLRV